MSIMRFMSSSDLKTISMRHVPWTFDGNLRAELLFKSELHWRSSPRIQLVGLRFLRLIRFGGLHRHDFLGAANRQPFGNNARRKLFHISFSRNPSSARA